MQGTFPSHSEHMRAMKVLSNYSISRRDRRLHRRKRKLYLAQKGRCCFCDVKMYACSALPHPANRLATFEHVHPRSLGGKDTLNNLMISCYRCNKIRGCLDYDLFASVVKFCNYEKLPSVATSLKAKLGVKH